MPRVTNAGAVLPRLADELRAEQENAQQHEASRKSMEVTVKDLTIRLDEAEANAVKVRQTREPNGTARGEQRGEGDS